MPRGRPAKPISANKSTKETGAAYREESHSNDSDSPDRSIPTSPNTSWTLVSSTDTSYSRLSPLSSQSSPAGTSFTGSTGSDTSSPKASPSCSRRLYPTLPDSSSKGDHTARTYPNLDDISKDRSPKYTENKSSHLSQSTVYECVESRPALVRRQTYGNRADDDNDKNFQKKSHDKDKDSNVGAKYILRTIICIIVLMIFCFVILFYIGSKDEKEMINKYDFFTREIKKLQPNFPNQNQRLWKSVIASSRHVLKEPNSTYPSVIILASQAQTPDLSFCIAKRIASSFLQSHNISSNVPSVDIESLKELDADEQKLSLDRQVQSALRSSHGKAFVIRNLQSLSPQAALLLHGLCDGDNAPFKDVMILMTLEVKRMPPMTADEIEDYLTQLWTTPQVEYDKVSAVMSRISNNLVIVKGEDSNVVDQFCPHH